MSENTENIEVQNQPRVDTGTGMSDGMKAKLAAIEGVTGSDSNIVSDLKKEMGVNDTPIEGTPYIPEQLKQQQIPHDQQAPDNQQQQQQATDNQQQQQAPPQDQRSEAQVLQDSQNPNENNAYFSLDHELYGGRKEFGAEKEVNPLGDFTPTQEVNDYVKKAHGLDSFGALMDDYKSKTEQAEELTRHKADYEKTKNEIESLPLDLQEALLSYSNGEDYTRAFKQKRLDYNIDFQDQNKKAIIDHYFPGEVTSDDWSQSDSNSDDFDPRAARIVDTYLRDSKDAYNEERGSVRRQTEEYRLQVEESGRSRVDAVNTAMSELKNKYPGSTASFNDKVYNALNNNDMDRMLRNPDGTYKPEAAILFVEMTEGPSLRGQLERQAREKATSSANEDILSRGTSSPRMSGGGGQSQQEESDAFKKRMKEISLFDGNNVY